MKIRDKNSNVSFIKLIAALMVILCHSYPLTGKGTEFLNELTNGKAGLGVLAVSAFFTFSGFYLSKSLERNDNTKLYFKKRIGKIFPPLVTVVLISILVIGPVFTTFPLIEYFSDKRTYLYFLNALLLPIHELPGVFTNAPYNPTVNGSLWTLPVEFGCYIFLLILFKIKKVFNRKYVNALLLIFVFVLCPVIAVMFKKTPFAILASAVSPFSMFCMGHLYWEIKDKILVNKYTILVEVLALLIGLNTSFHTIVFVCVFPLFLLSITNTEKEWGPKGVLENISYEVYLWGWPIGQIIVELVPNISVAAHFIINVVTAMIISILMKKIGTSWKTVTRKTVNGTI